jgi:hypothetical protein
MPFSMTRSPGARARALLSFALALSCPIWALGDAPASSIFRHPATGILRPDEGTLEVTVRPDKGKEEFGNQSEYIFKAIPAREPARGGGNNVMGLLWPFLPDRGLLFIVRTGSGTYRVSAPDFSPVPGKAVNIACTWGAELRLYADGVLLAKSKLGEPIARALIPSAFQVERLNSWRASAYRICTRALSAEELSADPTKRLSRDGDTALWVGPDFKQVLTNATPWQKSQAGTWIVPVQDPQAWLFREGQSAQLTLLAVSWAAGAPSTLGLRILDSDDRPVMAGTYPLAFPADGAHRKIQIPLPALGKPDHYRLDLTIQDGKQKPVPWSAALSLLPAADPAPEGALAMYYGQHHEADWSTEVLTHMGARSTRAWDGGRVFLWHAVEPTEGNFSFDAAEAYVAQCRSAGIEVLGLLANPPRWAAEEPDAEHQKKHPYAMRPERWKPRSVEAWGRYVFETVKHFRGRVAGWEIYNEVNFCPPARPGSFSGSPDDYLALLREAWKQAKRADPACKILISGFTPAANLGVPIDLLARGAGDAFDIFNLHGYMGTATIKPWLAALEKAKPGASWWQTEQMWHELSDMKLRAVLAPAVLVDFLEAGCGRFFNMGLREVFFNRYGHFPLADYQTLAVMVNRLKSCDRLSGVYAFPEASDLGWKHHLARRDGKTLSILGADRGQFEITVAGGVEEAMGLFGGRITRQAVPGGWRFTNEGLAYLTGPSPLTAITATLIGGRPLCRNGGFEEIQGDVVMGGLAAGSPMGFALREKSQDPEGSILLSTNARAGQFAIAIRSSGKGRVFLFQDLRIRSAGTYRFSAWFRKVGGGSDLLPYLSVNNRDSGKFLKSTLAKIRGDVWERLDLESVFDAPTVKDASVGLGIFSGAGEVLVDDLSIELIQQK